MSSTSFLQGGVCEYMRHMSDVDICVHREGIREHLISGDDILIEQHCYEFYVVKRNGEKGGICAEGVEVRE